MHRPPVVPVCDEPLRTRSGQLFNEESPRRVSCFGLEPERTPPSSRPDRCISLPPSPRVAMTENRIDYRTRLSRRRLLSGISALTATLTSPSCRPSTAFGQAQPARAAKHLSLHISA